MTTPWPTQPEGGDCISFGGDLDYNKSTPTFIVVPTRGNPAAPSHADYTAVVSGCWEPRIFPGRVIETWVVKIEFGVPLYCFGLCCPSLTFGPTFQTKPQATTKMINSTNEQQAAAKCFQNQEKLFLNDVKVSGRLTGGAV